MSPIRTQWNRLIRFLAVETSQIHIGEPLNPTLDIGLAVHNKERVQAYEIEGSALDPTARVTKRVLTVKNLLTPIPREQVGLVRCLGLNYADHATEANLPLPTAPVLFYKPLTTLIDPSSSIVIPKCAQPPEKYLPDYEAELVVAIGKPARDVKVENALDYVLGYMAGNDTSFRFHQFLVSQWDFSKGFDDTTPIGPVLVSRSQIPDPQNVPLKATVNGQLYQDGSTSKQVFTVAQTIAYLSQGTTLLPGSLILTGTPSGVGYIKKPSVFLRHGDDVRIWVGGGIGTLINSVREEKRDTKL